MGSIPTLRTATFDYRTFVLVIVIPFDRAIMVTQTGRVIDSSIDQFYDLVVEARNKLAKSNQGTNK